MQRLQPPFPGHFSSHSILSSYGLFAPLTLWRLSVSTISRPGPGELPGFQGSMVFCYKENTSINFFHPAHILNTTKLCTFYFAQCISSVAVLFRYFKWVFKFTFSSGLFCTTAWQFSHIKFCTRSKLPSISIHYVLSIAVWEGRVNIRFSNKHQYKRTHAQCMICKFEKYMCLS